MIQGFYPELLPVFGDKESLEKSENRAIAIVANTDHPWWKAQKNKANGYIIWAMKQRPN
jgi:hypothetical protein